MTLPIFLALHLAYGALMAFTVYRRMQSEGVVLGFPLVATLAPVGFVSAPIGSALLRYSGAWFLHGLPLGTGSIAYERFHLGLMLAVTTLAGAMTVAGSFFVIACVSRGKGRLARVPYWVAGIAALLTLALDAHGVFIVAGTGGRGLWQHPAGALSVVEVALLAAAWLAARSRLSVPVRPAGTPGSVVAR